MADYLPKFMPGQAFTRNASAKVEGGRLVEVSGSGQVAHAGADSAKVLGVAAFDAEAGEIVTVFRDGIHKLVATGAVAAGARVSAAADGKVSATGTNRIGLALTSAAKSGDVIEVAL